MKKIKNHSNLLFISAVICSVCVFVMIIALSLPPKNGMGAFVPPPFDESACQGIPTPDESLAWLPVEADELCFSARICAEFTVSEGSAEVWFSNDAENSVWLKLRVYDTEGNILGETGLIKPGEYVRNVSLGTVPRNGAPIIYKIMSYEPDTYHSMGAVTLRTTATVTE